MADAPDNLAPPIRILLVDDCVEDCELITRELGGLELPFELRRVEEECELRACLLEFRPQVVLSDHRMPRFSGMRALQAVRAIAPTVPFIFVSGTLDQTTARQALRDGAADFISKKDMTRLAAAVLSAIGNAHSKSAMASAMQSAQDSDARSRAVIESSGDWVWEGDLQHRLVYSNDAVESILGYRAQDILGRCGPDLAHPEDRARVRQLMDAQLEALTGWRGYVSRWQHTDGSVRWLEGSAAPRTDANGHFAGFRGVVRDVTQRMRHEAKIRQLGRFHALLSELARSVMEARALSDLLALTCRLCVDQGKFKAAIIRAPDGHGHLRIAASAGDGAMLARMAVMAPAERASDALREELLRRVFDQARIESCADTAASQLPEAVRREFAELGVGAYVILPVGAPPWATLALLSPVPHDFGEAELAVLGRLTGVLDYARTALAKAERLEYLAYHDSASGLPNRASFERHGRRLLAEGSLRVAAIQIEDFQGLQSVRGRAFAQGVLSAIAQRLAELLPPSCHLAHPGSEYFLLTDQHRPADVAALTLCLERCSREPVWVHEEAIYFGVRAGVVHSPEHGDDLETLERNALYALAEADKRDVTVFEFTEAMRAGTARRATLERDLRRAVAERQFELYLQPKFRAASGNLCGAEALLRWQHASFGFVSPGEFVPLLESTGLISAAGHWVMQTAQATLERWRAAGLGDHRIAVNVSAREFRHPDFISRCEAALAGGRGIDVEVTESVVMHDIDRTVALLEALKRFGCGISIDDFGTGYSSLNYLARLPADELKIDQTFIAGIDQSGETLSLVTNIISLAHSLNLKVVAEGVETEEQHKLLRLLRCDMVQGYLLGRPMPIADFEARFLAPD